VINAILGKSKRYWYNFLSKKGLIEIEIGEKKKHFLKYKRE